MSEVTRYDPADPNAHTTYAHMVPRQEGEFVRYERYQDRVKDIVRLKRERDILDTHVADVKGQLAVALGHVEYINSVLEALVASRIPYLPPGTHFGLVCDMSTPPSEIVKMIVNLPGVKK